MPAALYLVATPIGNLEDITLRALRVLRDEVAVIACEDTRQTRKLLEHYEIRKPLLSYHEHNETTRARELLQALEKGESVALVSDAGTPMISDPGYRIATAAIERGIRVVPVPGASAALAALTASGLPIDEFRFIGFLPPRASPRRAALEKLAHEPVTLVAYESPHRIHDTLADLARILGDRPIVLARELTKIHEEFLRGSAQSILDQLSTRESLKGEITLVIGRGNEKPAKVADPADEVLRLQTENGLDRMEAIKTVARRMGLPKRQVYQEIAERGSSRQGKSR
ncbi:MAG: 16S rRNA (cytidine(1402)-2'-O)-methyltransferase [Acidobacteriaceae bacterium]|nr:16S rRNA (cytidine(1402)-2'-O)-methyltransferase [Acidobacteriaceae bacterium]